MGVVIIHMSDQVKGREVGGGADGAGERRSVSRCGSINVQGSVISHSIRHTNERQTRAAESVMMGVAEGVESVKLNADPSLREDTKPIDQSDQK